MSQLIYYSEEDLESIIKLVKKNKFKKVYITGAVKTGKSHFSEKFEKVTGFLFIDLDKERECRPEESRSEILSKVINANKNNSYILDYYRLLDENDGQEILKIWKEEADILILLDPKHNPNLIPNFLDEFNKLGGEIIYQNINTGTYAKFMGKNDQPDK